MSKTQSELENLEQKNKASESKVYQCERCDVSAESYSQLKLHNRHDHCQNKVTQYENKFVFFKYNCFYCDDGFDSEEDLAKHLRIAITSSMIYQKHQLNWKLMNGLTVIFVV